MSKFNIPKRKYAGGDKKMVSLRVSQKLWDKIGQLAEKNGWPVTDLVTTVLDQYVQQEEGK